MMAGRSKRSSSNEAPAAVGRPGTAPSSTWEGRVLDRSLGKARQRSLEKASAILHAAARLMERTKGDAFTVQDVAAEAGQSLRSVYQHFGGKEDLFVAVFEEAMRVYANLLGEAVEQYDDPLDRLIAGVVSVAHLTKKSSQGLVVAMTRLRMRLTETNPEKVAESTGPVTEILRRLVVCALEAGVVHDCDPDTVAFSLFALGSAVTHAHFLGDTYALEMPSDTEFVRFCLRGMSADLPEDWIGRHGLGGRS